ncbi:MAG: hypothetical protein U5L45_01150 [Saprospiraceae bacterium]|nr:hypothetical protein [Saprospiraceae bacterium]
MRHKKQSIRWKKNSTFDKGYAFKEPEISEERRMDGSGSNSPYTAALSRAMTKCP